MARKNIFRRVEDRVDNRARKLRNRLDDPLERRVPKVENRNIGNGIGVGAIEAGIAKILDDTLGVPFGSDTEIVDAEPIDGGMKYYVNVDAPLRNMARMRGFFEAGTGFTSLLTDEVDVEDVDVVKTRVLRDTYQIVVNIRD